MNLRQRAAAVIAAISGKGVTPEQIAYAGASRSDLYGGRRHTSTNYDALQVVSAMQGYATFLANMNAANAASVPVSVYTRKSTALGRMYQTKAASRRQMKHLNSGHAGAKAADWASVGGEYEELTSGPIVDLLARPNAFATAGQIDRLKYLDQQQAGSCFMALGGKGKVPEAMYRLDPTTTKAIPNPETGIVEAFTYGKDQGNILELSADEVLWYRHYINPRDQYDGWSPARAVLDEFAIIAATLAHDIAFIEGGMRPDSVVGLPAGTSPEIVNTFREQMRQRHRGVSKVAEPMFVTGEITMVPLNWSPKDLTSEATIERAYRNVRNAFGVPESMADLNEANLASSKTGFDRQYAGMLRHMTVAQSEQETTWIARAFDLDPGDILICADDPMPDAVVEETQRHVARVAAGLMTINEAREEVGDDPSMDPAAAKLRINGQTLEALDREPPAPMSFGFGGPSSPPAAPEPAPAVPSLPTTPAPQKAVSEPEPEPYHPDVKAWLSTDPDPWAVECCDHKAGADLPVILNAPDEAIEALAAKVERYNRDLINRFLADPTIDTREMVAELERVLGEDIERVMARVAFDTAGLPGSPDDIADAADLDRFNLVNERTLARAAEVSKELAATINETTLSQVQNALTRGLAEGQTTSEIASAIQGSNIPRTRANVIARTELSRAHGAGQLEGFKATGITHKAWDRAPGACPICNSIKAKTDNGGAGIPIDEPFWAGGPLTGSDGRTYNIGTVMTHPAHPNCRCQMREIGGD